MAFITRHAALCFVLLVVWKTKSVDSFEDAQTCYSRFDYDEKMLEKLVRLENKIDSLQNKLESSVAKPNAFFHALGISTSSPSSGSTLVFTDVKLDSDQLYNNTTGVFEANTEGLYWFAAYICTTANRYVNYNIMVNDQSMTNAISYDSLNSCSSANAVAELHVGDRVFVKAAVASGGAVIFENELRSSMFTGALIN